MPQPHIYSVMVSRLFQQNCRSFPTAGDILLSDVVQSLSDVLQLSSDVLIQSLSDVLQLSSDVLRSLSDVLRSLSDVIERCNYIYPAIKQVLKALP